MSDNKPDQLLECIQVILTGHYHTEDVSSDISVHPLFPSQIQDFGAKLKLITNESEKSGIVKYKSWITEIFCLKLIKIILTQLSFSTCL